MQKEDTFQIWQQQRIDGLLHAITNDASFARMIVNGLEDCNLVLPEGKDDFNALKECLIELVQYIRLLRGVTTDWEKPRLQKITASRIAKVVNELVKAPSSITMEISIDNGVDKVVVNVVFDQLMMVFNELLLNARYALVDNKNSLINVNLSTQNDYLKISIKDNGKGFPSELLPHLFKEPLNSGKMDGGRGLLICSKVIHLMGGKLLLESTSEKGSAFVIMLPICTDGGDT